MKKLFALFFFVFLIGLVSSAELSMSPTQLDFNMTTNQKSCSQIIIHTEESGFLIGEDRWAEKGITEKKFSLHKLSSDDLDLEINYPKRFEAKNFTATDICITAKKSGLYHGLLLYKIESDNAGVGIWITANISKKENILVNKITGNSINLKNNSVFVLSIATLFSAIILIFLMLKLNRKKKLTLQ